MKQINIISITIIAGALISCLGVAQDTAEEQLKENAVQPKMANAKFASAEIESANSVNVEVSSKQSSSTPLKFENLSEICMQELKKFPGKFNENDLKLACSQVTLMNDCVSVDGRPIYQFEKKSSDTNAKTILVFSMIHGDESHAGTVGRFWMERLSLIDPRNSWRIVPVLNPDGTILKTRTNANKIDLNRNFPTRDWNELAVSYWKKKTKSAPRRFPGDEAGSEPEVKCALSQIADYKPNFIISVHTPLKVLDFDGPKVSPPRFDYLPWKSLGHFPGSLGRYMWFERQVPVLTLELRESLPNSLTQFEKLQDLIGGLVKVSIDNKATDVSQLFLESDHK